VITRVNGVTRINVIMRMYFFLYIFVILMYGGIGLGFMVILISSINNNKFEPAIFIPLGMLIFLYLLTMGGFKSESSISKKDLEKILNSRIKE